MDGAAGWPLRKHSNKTTLELAHTPNLDALTREGLLGMTDNVPQGMEPSSAVACMSLLGYDPSVYYKGRAAIEAVSMGVPIKRDETIFRCNLVTLKNGRMLSYSSGHIENDESHQLVDALNDQLGNEIVKFYAGVGYRHLLKIKGHTETAHAVCTPPHDISGKAVAEYMPKGRGSRLLNHLMQNSQDVLRQQVVNYQRVARGQMPATSIWLFWGSGSVPRIPSFMEMFQLSAALTSGVDLLRGLGMMMGMELLDIQGVADNMTNNFAGQAEGALMALKKHDLVVIHVEAPDEAGHAGNAAEKIEAIERIDSEIVSCIRRHDGELRLLVIPDHPTPVEMCTHVAEPVPFLMWGSGFEADMAQRFTEKEAKNTKMMIHKGHDIMKRFIGDR